VGPVVVADASTVRPGEASAGTLASGPDVLQAFSLDDSVDVRVLSGIVDAHGSP